jgi:hypothetical protein
MQRLSPITVLGCLVVAIGVIIGIQSLWPSSRPPQQESPPPGSTPLVVPDARTLATPHFDLARSKTESVVETHIAPVKSFFDDLKTRTREFAEISLGWNSKWLLIVDHAPQAIIDQLLPGPPVPGIPWLDFVPKKHKDWLKPGFHKKFIKQEFERTVFSQEQLTEVIRQAIEGYLAEIRSIENQMLVSLRADIAGFPDVYPIAQLDESQLRTKFDEAIQKAIAATEGQVQADIGTQLVSFIGGEVLAQVGVRLGISAGILGPGAISSWKTFGISVVVAIIVDQIVSWIWDWWADPTGNLAGSLDAKLDEMCTLICDGGTKVEGLRQRFQSLAAERAKIRETAILDLLSSNQGSK